MQQHSPTVYLVDDDPAFRDALSLLIQSAGMEVVAFADPEMLLSHIDPDVIGCIILDMRMPGWTGLELQAALTERNIHLPQIFLTGYGDVRQTVRALKNGAVDFLTKPVDDRLLLHTIHEAIRAYMRVLPKVKAEQKTQERLARLTKKENAVLHHVLDGLTNKEIANQLGIGIRTVETHRAAILEKLEAQNLAHLCRMCFGGHPIHRT
jgi:FixJ family two-component response regulator